MFELSYLENGFRFVYPPFVYDSEWLRSKLSNYPTVSSYHLSECADESRMLTVEFCKLEGQLNDAIRDLFSDINGLPTYDRLEVSDFKNASSPLISCLILLTANDLFVHNFLIPGIIRSSKDFPIEIIIVYNGCSCELNLFPNFKVTKSLFG